MIHPVSVFLYANYVEAKILNKRFDGAEVKLQKFLNGVTRWAKKLKSELAAEKSSAVAFSKSFSPQRVWKLFLKGRRISCLKFLCLTGDQKLLWKKNSQQVVKKCISENHFLQSLGEKKCSPLVPSLISLFKSFIKSIVEYGLIL